MNLVRGAAGGLAILAATVGGVAAVAFALGAWITPGASLVEPTPTPQPTFDLAVPPDVIGGSLEISGDRSGTMTLDTASGIGLERMPNSGAYAPTELQGPAGHIRFDRDTGRITHIAYHDLSIFLDPDECTVTHGAVNEATDLMVALVECADITDIRGQAVVSLTGVIALRTHALLGRGDLPRTGGSVELDGSAYDFGEVEISLDGEQHPSALDPAATQPQETGRIREGIIAVDTAVTIVLEYDPATDRFFVSGFTSGFDYAEFVELCPVGVHELGGLNDFTTVMRLDIECADVAVSGGGTRSVSGSIVVDVIQGWTETIAEP